MTRLFIEMYFDEDVSHNAAPSPHGRISKALAPKQRGELMGNSAEINQRAYSQVIDHQLRLAVERVNGELFTNCSLETGWVN